MKINKQALISFYAFLCSPLLAIPFIGYQLRKGADHGVCAIVAALYGILSYRYVAHIDNDKARYVERYQLFKSYSPRDLLEYFVNTKRPDFLFDSLNFLFAKIDIDVRVFFFFVTFFSVYSYLVFVKSLASRVGGRDFTYSSLVLVGLVLSISLPNLLSGIRFMFAGSLFVWFVYYFCFDRRVVRSGVFLGLAVFTHFSYIFLVGPVLLATSVGSVLFAKVALATSFVFLLVPKSVVGELLQFFSFSGGQTNKVEIYTSSEYAVSESFYLLQVLRNLWLYTLCGCLLFFRSERRDYLFFLIVFMVSFVNVVYSIPVAYDRYAVFLKIMFFAVLVSWRFRSRLSGFGGFFVYYFFVFLFFLGFFADLFVLRYNIDASYSLLGLVTLFHAFFSAAPSDYFLY